MTPRILLLLFSFLFLSCNDEKLPSSISKISINKSDFSFKEFVLSINNGFADTVYQLKIHYNETPFLSIKKDFSKTGTDISGGLLFYNTNNVKNIKVRFTLFNKDAMQNILDGEYIIMLSEDYRMLINDFVNEQRIGRLLSVLKQDFSKSELRYVCADTYKDSVIVCTKEY